MAGKTMTLAAVATVACLLPAAACSSSSKDAPMAPVSLTQPPSASATTPSNKPQGETALERQARLDQEAAIRAYRTALAESSRIFLRGGSDQLPKSIKLVATGGYLELIDDSARLLKENGWRLTQRGTIVSVYPQGWSSQRVHLKACEDNTHARVVDDKGVDHTAPGKRRYVQDYTVVEVGSTWKLASVVTTKVSNFASYGCSS